MRRGSPFGSTASPADESVRRQGAVLLLTIVLLLVGSLIVGALASYSVSALRAMPTARSRTTRVESVKSALRMAMTLQRDFGPSGCFDDVTAYTVSNLPVTVTCASTASYATGNDRYGVITTANTNNVGSLTGRSGGSTFAKRIDGKLLLNAGMLSGATDVVPNNTTLEMSRYQSGATRRSPGTAPAAPPRPRAATTRPSRPVTSIRRPRRPTPLSCTNEPWWKLGR